MELRKEVEASHAAGGPRGTITEGVLHGLENHVAACGLQAIVGINFPLIQYLPYFRSLS